MSGLRPIITVRLGEENALYEVRCPCRAADGRTARFATHDEALTFADAHARSSAHLADSITDTLERLSSRVTADAAEAGRQGSKEAMFALNGSASAFDLAADMIREHLVEHRPDH